jgi:hypothetical protein
MRALLLSEAKTLFRPVVVPPDLIFERFQAKRGKCEHLACHAFSILKFLQLMSSGKTTLSQVLCRESGQVEGSEEGREGNKEGCKRARDKGGRRRSRHRNPLVSTPAQLDGRT